MKRLLIVTLIALFVAPLAFAIVDDGCIVSVTPSNPYSIQIDTNGASTNFGQLASNAISWSTATTGSLGASSANVKNNGNASADWEIKANKINTWDLRPRSGQDKDSVTSDNITLCAILCPAATVLASVTDGSFQFDDMLDGGDFYDMEGTSFTCHNADLEAATDDIVDDGNNVAVNSTRQLYFRIKAPSDTTVNSEQKFQVIIRAISSAHF